MGKRGRKFGEPRVKQHFLEVPEDVKQIWKQMEFLKEHGIEKQVHRVVMKPYDELEIITPKDYYVMGCDPGGKMIIGQTRKSPEFLKVMAMDHTNSGAKFNIPKVARQRLSFAKENRIQVWLVGDALLLRPIIEIPEKKTGRCSECGRNMQELPLHYKSSSMTLLGKTYYFCTKACRTLFRRNWMGKQQTSRKGNVAVETKTA